jgi:putative chitinase
MSFIITKSHVTQFIKKNPDIWYPLLAELLPKYEINTALRVAGFLAQCSHESLNFTVLKENLNYSAEGLNATFSKYFIRAGRDASTYARNPEKIANIVYAGRLGNGDTASGDGWRFRGRGVIQLTGRDNYTAFGKTKQLTALETVDYLETSRGALESACWFWKINKLNALADAQDILAMSTKINGGTNGLEDRKVQYKQALRILTV